MRPLLKVAGFPQPRVESQTGILPTRSGAGAGARVPGAAAAPTHLRPAEAQAARRERRVGKARGSAAQRWKPQLAQGPPRHPFQTRDAGEPRGTRAPPDRAQHPAGRFVRSCHPKPAATPRRARRVASLYLRALARRRALLWAAPGCTGRPDPHCQLQQLGRRRFRPYHAVTRSGRSPQAQGAGGSRCLPRPVYVRHRANSAAAKGGA